MTQRPGRAFHVQLFCPRRGRGPSLHAGTVPCVCSVPGLSRGPRVLGTDRVRARPLLAPFPSPPLPTPRAPGPPLAAALSQGRGRSPGFGVDSASAPAPPASSRLHVLLHWLFLRGARRVDSAWPCPGQQLARPQGHVGGWPVAGGAEAAGLTARVPPEVAGATPPAPPHPAPPPQLQHQSFGVWEGVASPLLPPPGLGSGSEGPGCGGW